MSFAAPVSEARAALIAAEGRPCPYCGAAMRDVRPPTRDHILARSRGGGDGAVNIAIVCSPCNNDKGDKTLDEFAAALSLGGDPRAPRVRAFLARWALATTEGTT